MNYLTSKEAYDLLQSDDNIKLIDLRREEEWEKSVPNVSNLIKISSHIGPNYEPNTSFIKDFEKNIPNKDTKIILICKTNGRSSIASQILKEIGYVNVQIIIDGFEGSEMGIGWLKSNLPIKTL